MQTGTYLQLAPVLFGSGTLSQVGAKAVELGMTKVMVVTDKGIAALGHPQKVVASLEEAGLEALLWDEAQPEAPCDSVREAAGLARNFGADGLVGIGGGSCMDTAKALGRVITNGDEVLDDVLAYLVGEKKYTADALPVIAIPTTAGTGSEVTCVAILNNPKLDEKNGLPTNSTLAIVDPELTVGSPAGLTSTCGMDAFGHAVESLTAVGCTPHTEMCAYEAIRQITQWLPVAVEDKMNLEAREHMSFAANIAGIAFSEDNCHVAHIVGQICGHSFNQPHGLTIAWATPSGIEYVAPDHPDKVRGIGRAMGLAGIEEVDDAQIGTFVADAVRDLMRRIGIPSLAEKGIEHDAFMEGADEALGHELVPYYDGEVTRERIVAMMERMYNWK